MIKKRIKRILKLGILITARQGWKLISNLYHLVNEPFLTIKDLLQEKDKSQILLILIIMVSPIMVYLMARFIWDFYKYGVLLNSVGNVFLLVSVIQLMVWGYIIYWIYRVIKHEHSQ